MGGRRKGGINVEAIRVASACEATTEATVEAVIRQLGASADGLWIAFCAARLDADRVAAALSSAAGARTRIIGCTTSGEIGPAGFQKDSLVVIALPGNDFVASTTTLRDIDHLDTARWRDQLETALVDLDTRRLDGPEYGRFAFTLIDGLSMREDAVGHAMRAVVGHVPLFGGSAGDDLTFTGTRVIHGGRAYDNAAVVALVRTRRPFHVFKTQHFERSDIRMVVTGARPAERIVTEINGLPAAEEYLRLTGLGVHARDLDPMAFAAYPVLVRIGSSDHVRSIQKVNADGSLTFYCAIEEGIVLRLGHGLDPLDNLARTFAHLPADVAMPEAVITCDCILRRLEFAQSGALEPVSNFIRQHHVTGFSGYGELYEGVHLNQTFTGIALGHRDTETHS